MEIDGLTIPAPIKSAIVGEGLIDSVHCVMSDKTHLNFLADWIDLKEAIYSPGDLCRMLGSYTWNYAAFLWAVLMCVGAWKREEKCLSTK